MDVPPPFAQRPEPETGPWFFCLRHDVGAGAIGIVMVGEFDIAAADDARDVISRAQAAAPEVICDLHDVSFIDPCGLHVLVDAAASARRHNARLTLANPSASVRRLIELVGLEITLRAERVASAPRPRSAYRPRSNSSPVRLTRDRDAQATARDARDQVHAADREIVSSRSPARPSTLSRSTCGQVSTRGPADTCRGHVSTTRVKSRRAAGASCSSERRVR
ncbi:MAG: STAS domain-containing protein [Solirubrobacteraceae bacterium]